MILLFDFGGVLVRLNKARCIAAFDKLGFDVRPYIGTFAQRGFISRLERGEIGVHEFCDELRRLAHRPDLTDEVLVAAWEAYLEDVPAERLEMLIRAARHYPVYLLSNTNPIHWHQAETQLFRYKDHDRPEDYFRRTFLSFEIGFEKPAPEIYAAAIAGIGAPAADILFFDDAETNCEAARRAGLQARLAPADGSWLEHFTPDGLLRN